MCANKVVIGHCNQSIHSLVIVFNICNNQNEYILEESCSEEDDDELPYFDAFSVRQMSVRQT